MDPHPDPGSQAAIAAVLESDSRRLVEFCPWEIIEHSPRWLVAVLTAVVVTQMSVGGSLKATIEYLIGTLGGAIYAGVIAVLIPPVNEISLLIALAMTVAPLALLAAINVNFRVAPFTAVIVAWGFFGHPCRPGCFGSLPRARGRDRGMMASQSLCCCFPRVLTSGNRSGRQYA